jgi:hypothetical protein
MGPLSLSFVVGCGVTGDTCRGARDERNVREVLDAQVFSWAELKVSILKVRNSLIYARNRDVRRMSSLRDQYGIKTLGSQIWVLVHTH